MSTNALAIREAIFVRLLTLPGYKTYRRVSTPQLQSDDLPCLSAIIMSEQMVPDGDENAGEPSFISSSTIGISIVRGFADPIVLDGQIDVDITSIEEWLLTDPTFVRFGPKSLFEGVSQVSRRRIYPFEGETYFLELRLEITFVSRSSYPPNIVSPFRGITMETLPYGTALGTAPINSAFDVTE